MPNCPFRKISVVRCVFCAIFFLMFLIVYDRIHFFDIVERIERKPGIIYLLQWTSPKTEPFVFMGTGTKTFEERKCQVANCFVTANKYALGAVQNFDVLLFHAKEFIEEWFHVARKERNDGQKYVFASMESSGNYPDEYNKVDDTFNITWTYKLDSDINFGYIAIRNKSGHHIGPKTEMQWMNNSEMLPIDDNIKNKLEKKRIAAAWFVSHCDAVNKRENVAYEMFLEMRHFGMTLDIYGSCGQKQCPRSSMKECLRMIQRDYYFYLAFENSNAEDYVTEKLLTALKNYAVPVVFGGANYTRFMPDGIYLDVMKLGIKGVVREMQSLIQDKSKYHDYFKWHNHYSYHNIEDSPDSDPYCQLCEYLHKMINITEEVNDLSSWWNVIKPQKYLVEQLNITV